MISTILLVWKSDQSSQSLEQSPWKYIWFAIDFNSLATPILIESKLAAAASQGAYLLLVASPTALSHLFVTKKIPYPIICMHSRKLRANQTASFAEPVRPSFYHSSSFPRSPRHECNTNSTQSDLNYHPSSVVSPYIFRSP